MNVISRPEYIRRIERYLDKQTINPKYIISMTPLVKRNNDEGIIHLGLREFLVHGLA